MKLSAFGEKFVGPSGIGALMDDLGTAMASDRPVLMLGGGNPGDIPNVQRRLAAELVRIGQDPQAFASVAGSYDAPQGNQRFIDALVGLLERQYGWGLSAANIALTNGSQSAFFYLFNMLAGPHRGGVEKKILLPLAPEYIGYSDVFVQGGHFVANRPHIEYREHQIFKYRVDFDALEVTDDIAAICVSRPTNPTGNVLTDAEMAHLDDIAKRHDIPLIVDNAYGLPFPNIIFTEAELCWNDNTILCMSLSKLGLPGLRTGIVIAKPEVIQGLAALNAITALAPHSIAAELVAPLLESDEVLHLSRDEIEPFYRTKALAALEQVRAEFTNYPVWVHEPEGALFLWLWFKDLPISTTVLYQRLKQRGVLIIPGEFFFPGIRDDWAHKYECIRLTYSQADETVRAGIAIIGEEVRAAYDSAQGANAG